MDTASIYMLRFELTLLLLIFLFLLLKLLDADKHIKGVLRGVNWLLFANFLIGFAPIDSGALFQGFFHSNELIVLEKSMLNLGVLLISLLSSRWLKHHATTLLEFYILLTSSLLGAFLMLSSGHILMLYLGIEISTIPITALSNFNKQERRSSEAGVKFILSSAFSSGIMLYGISMLYGAYGNLEFSYLKEALTPNLLTLVAFSFIIGGLFFKMSAVPFHLWAADVYEGSPMPVTNYLSVISKGSIVFVFVSILVTVFENMREEWRIIISMIAILSMTVGNLFALRQTNMKRLLAFSSISQVGFLLVGATGQGLLGVDSTLYFMLIYMLSNVSAFGILGALVDSSGREDIEVFRGFYRSNPFLALMMTISLLSLGGVPPTSGFFGKLLLLTSSMSYHMYLLIGFAGLNMVVSLYNYLRIIRRIFCDDCEEDIVVRRPPLMDATLVLCSSLILAIGFISSVYQYLDNIAGLLFE